MEEESLETAAQVEEEERERRRMRDRQRRHSMTLEQRERHLARRRRNYQLRRLRADHYTLPPPPPLPHHEVSVEEELGFGSGGEMVIAAEHHDDQDDDDPIGQEKLNHICLQSVYQETLGGKAKTMRLSRLRCLARGGNIVNADTATTTLQLGVNDSTRLAGGVRLNLVKRLARGFNVETGQVDEQDQDLARATGNEDKTTL